MRIVLAAFASLALASSAYAAGVNVSVPPAISVAAPVGKTKPISLTRMAANIAPGTPWADERFSSGPIPIPCLSAGETSLWKEANNRFGSLETWQRVLGQDLAAAGFSAGGDPTNLFEDQKSSELQLGALITSIQLKSCTQDSALGETHGGSATMDVEWQVYSVTQGKVVARISTRGGVVLKPARNASALGLITGAFGDNVRRLAVDEQFRRIVTAGPSEVPPAPTQLSALALRLPTASSRIPIATAARGVVAIFAGESHGSGVMISPDGYILTNRHVAGSSGQVRVRWPDGAETVGDVIRADPRRDIALVKTTPRPDAVPIRFNQVLLGEAVFAIGTPLDAKLQGTVTRGIVSATRTFDGLSYIQSDVAVNGGNSGGPLLDEKGGVVGITVSGIDINGAPVGINLFIPIDDALKALALTPAS